MAKNPKKIFENINKVEGLDVSALASITQGANGEDVKFIREKIKESWFRTVYPLGKIITETCLLSDSMAVVKATVMNENNEVLATGLGEGFYNPEDSVEKWFVSCAETRAKGRALSAAGFGCQFDESPDDLMLTEAGIPIKPKESGISDNFGVFEDSNTADSKASDNFEKNVEAVAKTLTPKMSKGILITYGPAKGITVEDIYKREKNEDKLTTIRKYAENSDGIFDKSHIEVAAACRVFIKGIEESLKKKQEE